MEDPEAYLRAQAAALATAREGSPLPVVRFSLEAVAHAFVILGLLPAARAEEILAAQRPVLQAAGVRLLVGREITELGVSRAARGLQEARAAAPGSLRMIPLAAVAGPVRCQLRCHGLTITSAALTPEGIRVRYHGDAREGDDVQARAFGAELSREITQLSITDDTGRTYLVPAGTVGGHVSGRRLAPGRTRWVPEGEFLATPAPGQAGPGGGRAAIRWLEFAAGPGSRVRVDMVSPAVLTGTAQPPWPTPGECYLAQLPPPARDWSLGSSGADPRDVNTVDLDTAAIVTAVDGALLAVGAVPPGSAVLAGLPGRVRTDWRAGLSPQQLARLEPWRGPGPAASAGLAARLPLQRATAVIENITARQDVVSIQLYGHPWVLGDSWPMITPCFQVTAVDDTGAEHEGHPRTGSATPACEGSGCFRFWPPVDPQAKQLKVTISTLWEAAWALIDIPGR